MFSKSVLLDKDTSDCVKLRLLLAWNAGPMLRLKPNAANASLSQEMSSLHHTALRFRAVRATWSLTSRDEKLGVLSVAYSGETSGFATCLTWASRCRFRR